MSSSRSTLRFVACASLLALSACNGSSTPTETTPPPPAPPSPVVPTVAPACANPAPLLGKFDPRAPGYLVALVSAKNFEATVATLAARHGFQVEYFYETIHSFAVRLEPETVAALRCELQVKFIEHNQILYAS